MLKLACIGLFTFFLALVSVANVHADSLFPCDLTTLAHPTKLTLSGETHTDLGAAMIGLLNISGAGQGSIRMAQEGEIFDPTRQSEPFKRMIDRNAKFVPASDKNKLHGATNGLEDEVPFGLASLIASWQSSISAVANAKENSELAKTRLASARSRLCGILSENAFIKDLWRSQRKAEPVSVPEGAESVAKQFDRMVAADGYEPAVCKGDWNLQGDSYEQAITLMGPLSGLLASSYMTITHPQNRKQYGVPDSVPTLPFDNPVQTLTQIGDQFDTVILDWRNQVFARHIGALYCEAAAAGKPFVASMGRAHMDGVARLLEAESRGIVRIEKQDADGEGALLRSLLLNSPKAVQEQALAVIPCDPPGRAVPATPVNPRIQRLRAWSEARLKEKDIGRVIHLLNDAKAALFKNWPEAVVSTEIDSFGGLQITLKVPDNRLPVRDPKRIFDRYEPAAPWVERIQKEMHYSILDVGVLSGERSMDVSKDGMFPVIKVIYHSPMNFQ